MRLAPGSARNSRSSSFLCSTPFGINEVGTRPLITMGLMFWRAQRLSASMRLARWARLPMYLKTYLCSTPFGINEVGTVLLTVSFHVIRVCSTPFGINEVGTKTTTRLRCYSKQCSTPFGINEVGTIRNSWNQPGG